MTSKASEPRVKFSPFYPHGNIPIPFSENSAESVEGIWQRLKVFEREDIDEKKFAITNMKGIERTVRKHGPVIGHRKGVAGASLLTYLQARKEIYIPVYNWVLENRLQKELEQLSNIAHSMGLVLLDYEANTDVNDQRKPLSHASLVKDYLLGMS